MTSIDAIERELTALQATARDQDGDTFLRLGEAVLACWVEARDEVPTQDEKEGFRLLALHRQGAKGDPSFNACRETCRELAYHYNLLQQERCEDAGAVREQMWHITNHLCLFISGKMQEAGLGEFCCSSKPIRLNQNEQLQN